MKLWRRLVFAVMLPAASMAVSAQPSAPIRSRSHGAVARSFRPIDGRGRETPIHLPAPPERPLPAGRRRPIPTASAPWAEKTGLVQESSVRSSIARSGRLKTRGRERVSMAVGPFLDHDLVLTETGDELHPIPVPPEDPYLAVSIPFFRSVYRPGTGHRIERPREQINAVTAYVDGSQIYGSDSVRALALRSLDQSGRLKVSANDLLPYNLDGLPNAGGDSASLFRQVMFAPTNRSV